jgi:hypothetical protein
MPLVLKMATPQHGSWCVLQLAKKESVTAMQRAFRVQFHMEPPSRVSIYAWYKKFEHKMWICKNKRPGRPSVSDATVDRVRACFQCSPHKSTRRASRELQLPQTTVSKILRKRLLMKPYKLQLVQALKPEDLADYRLDICRATRGAHIESLWGVYKTLRVFLSTGVGVKFQVRHICFLYHFESVKFFCVHPVPCEFSNQLSFVINTVVNGECCDFPTPQERHC